MPSAIGKAWHPLPRPQLYTLIRRTNFRPHWEPTGVWFKKLPDNWVGEGMDKTLFTRMVILPGNLLRVFNYEVNNWQGGIRH